MPLDIHYRMLLIEKSEILESFLCWKTCYWDKTSIFYFFFWIWSNVLEPTGI